MNTQLPSSANFIDLTGKQFSRWTVIEYAHKKGHHLYWKCRCTCGTEAVVSGGNLTRHLSKSCGCFRVEATVEKNHNSLKHGACGTPEYEAWHAILQRCNNPRHGSYHLYGGRGIKCLFVSFHTFLTDVGPRPSPEHSIDRYPDNDGNYEPGNVRWATRNEQGLNRRTTRLLTYNGKTMSVTEWAKRIGIPRATLFTRLHKGWSVDKALTYQRNS